MQAQSEHYEEGHAAAQRAVESGEVVDPFEASREADAMLRSYHYGRYSNGAAHRERDRGYRDAMHEVAVAQGPA